jgi:hypothetical protein
MSKLDIDVLLEEAIRFIEENWKRFAFIDNVDCAWVKLDRIPVLKSLSRVDRVRFEIRRNLIIKLQERGYKVILVKRTGTGHHSRNPTSALIICRDNTAEKDVHR